MFELIHAEDLAGWMTTLAQVEQGASDAERVELISSLEALKAAASAAQARATAELDRSQRAEQAARGVPARRRGEGIASQVGLARHESPTKGARYLGLAKVLVHEMPHTLALMTCGRLNEWRATLLARETACLDLEDRRRVDLELAGSGAASRMSDAHLVAAARRLAAKLDPISVAARARRAETERTVTIRPAPDTMTYVTALLPVVQGVAVYATLVRAADAARSSGDPRCRGQVMADALVERVTGRTADKPATVELRLVMTERSLFIGDDEPAYLPGYGSVPAEWARDLVTASLRQAQLWVRRLYTAPGTGQLVAMESRRRCAPPGLADLVETRDQLCRTPWCGAPIRQIDHVHEHQDGGATRLANLQGLCERCNHAKQGLDFTSRAGPGLRHTVDVTTPTGHAHRSSAPPLPGTHGPSTRFEAQFADLVLSA